MEAMMGWNACYSERQSQPWRCPPLPHIELSAAGSWGAFGVWGEVSRENKQRVAWGFRAIDIFQPVLSISVFSQSGWLSWYISSEDQPHEDSWTLYLNPKIPVKCLKKHFWKIIRWDHIDWKTTQNTHSKRLPEIRAVLSNRARNNNHKE